MCASPSTATLIIVVSLRVTQEGAAPTCAARLSAPLRLVELHIRFVGLDKSVRLPDMTTKERLHELVDELADEQADDLLRVVSELYVAPIQRRPLPSFVGAGDSGRGDISENVDEYLRQGWDGNFSRGNC